MPKNSLGNADWKRKKQNKMIFWVVVVSILFASVVGGLIFFLNSKR